MLLATRLGFPVSTTHALAGAMTGTGLAAAPQEVQLAKLWDTFGKPLMLSPLVAVGTGILVVGRIDCTPREGSTRAPRVVVRAPPTT